MAQDASSKAPLKFIVFELETEEVVYPPVAMTDAGGNRVMVINNLKKELTVHHGGHLDAADPFKVPAKGMGAPPRVTCDIRPGSDVAGTVFQFRVEASFLRAFGGTGDPVIIIL